MKQLISLILLNILLAGCQATSTLSPLEATNSSFNTPTTQSENSTPAVVHPSVTPSTVPLLSFTATTEPTTTPTEPLSLPDLALPAPSFLYFLEGTLFEQAGNQPPQLVTSLSQASLILASTMLDTQLIVLSDAGIIKIDLQDKTSSAILSFDTPVRFGKLLLVEQDKELIYQAVVDDLTFANGFGTHIGIYDAITGEVTPLADFPQAVQILGLSADQENLYLLPQGQDPSFGKVITLSMDSGEVILEYPIEGYGIPVLSPFGNYLVATTETRPSDGIGEGILVLNNLGKQPFESENIPLPNPLSHTENLIWSPDEQYLYFALASESLFSDALEYPRSSYGLWRLEVQTGELFQVTGGVENRAPFVIASSDGRWLLLRHQDSDLAIRLDLTTGDLQEYTLPVEGVPDFTADWAFSFFGKDGAWVFLQYYGKEEAAFIHLPTQTALSFAFPSKAVVVGWNEP